MNTTSFPREDIRVVLLEGISQTAVRQFRDAGYTNVQWHPSALAREALLETIADAHMIGIRSRTQLDSEVIAHARRLMAVGCFCIGTNQVDLEEAAGRAIPVFNAPYSNTRSVAELVVAEAVMLMRRVPERNAECHRGGWSKSAEGSYEVRGKTLGIVGYGHIGTQVGVLAEGLGMHVLYYDIESKLALGNAQAAGLDDLLERSDIVTLHVPDTPASRGMMGVAQLARMRRGALLINASRGTVVDIEALAGRLREGALAGAAVDVFPSEPKDGGDVFESPLRGLDNVILTPHVGGSTQEAQANIGIEVSSKLLRYSDNGSTLSAVNFPEVSLPEHAGSRRLLHVHRNEPGMLSRINALFSRSAVNVDAQYLRTSPRLGYVVIDVAATADEARELSRELAAIPGTLRTRLLH